jgi:hypothetical protein
MAGIFINYRVVDASSTAGFLYQTLVERFGANRVFRDCDTMEPGDDYPKVMRQALREADVLVVVIGPQWLTVRDDEGRRLIDRERDWVRWEIAEALRLGKAILPVVLANIPSPHKGVPPSATMPTKEQLPDDIRGLATKQYAELDQRRLSEDIKRLLARIVALAPGLVIADLFEPPRSPGTGDEAPSTLLLPQHEIVPLIGREEELADLRSWATGSAACSAALIVGSIGSGKTRLARALCDEFVKRGWLAGMVRNRVSALRIVDTREVGRPILAVVDEAETRTEQLTALARTLGKQSVSKQAPVRLLLIARSGGEWLTGLRTSRDGDVAGMFRTITRPTVSLTAPTDGPVHLKAAREAFAEPLKSQLKFELKSAVSGESPSPSIDFYDSWLDIHAAALGSLLTAEVPRVTATVHPLDRLLYADRKHWRRLARREGQEHLRTLTFSVVGTLATVCRPSSDEEAEALVNRLSRFLGMDGALLHSYAQWLHRLYPGPNLLSPVRPDALGEHLIAATFAAEPSVAAAIVAVSTDAQLTNALTVLGNAVTRHPQLSQDITNLAELAPRRVVGTGIDVADRLERADVFSRALADAIDDNVLGFDDAFALFDRVAKAGPNVAPLKAALVHYGTALGRAATGAFHDRTGGETPPELQPLQRVADSLTDTVADLLTALIDPGSKRAPITPDGRPIVPPFLLDVLRKLTVTNEWFPRQGDDLEDD